MAGMEIPPGRAGDLEARGTPKLQLCKVSVDSVHIQVSAHAPIIGTVRSRVPK